MTAAVETDGTPPAEMPKDAHPITLPVMVVEGMETSDGRYITPGALSTRPLPIGLYAQTRSTHGAEGDAATWLVGAITEAQRHPGPEVTQLSTGQPFPEGTFVWSAKGWMYDDVPAAPAKSAYALVRDRALRGNSVDLSAVEAEFEYAEDAGPADPPERIVTHKAVIAATTLVGQPAFQDAYITLDGVQLADEPVEESVALVAAATAPAWRASEIGDTCSPCALGHPLIAAVDSDTLQLEVDGDDLDAADMPGAQDYSTSGMIALVPTNPAMLRVPGGEPAEQLHLTLAYLGNQVDEWEPEQALAVLDAARRATDKAAQNAYEVRLAHERGEDEPVQLSEWVAPAQKGPLRAGIFSHAIFNPNGDNGFDPATVYLLDGTGDRSAIDELAQSMQYEAQRAIGTAMFPQQHTPYVPHVTAGYGLPIEQLTYTGPVEFDRLRVAIGDTIRDFPLGGGPDTLVASAATLPPADIWADPQLEEPTPPTVTEDGRCYGHLALWGTCHIGFAGKCVTPPRSPSGYSYFMVHSVRARDRGGEVVTVPVGYGTIGTGHADIRSGALAAAEHYDNSGTAAFEIAVGEDDHGIWFAGRLMPGLDEATEHRARGTVFSGDWRTIRGQLEMVAALGVNTPGFPVPRALAAGGQPLAIVAAGGRELAGVKTAPGLRPTVAALMAGGGRTTMDRQTREVIEYMRGKMAEELHGRAVAELEELLGDGLTASEMAEAELAFLLEVNHPWLADDLDLAPGEDTDDGFSGVLVAAGRKVLHLPGYIKRIANHLKKKGMTQGYAIATAVNAAKKMCSTGDLNFPGSQNVNPGSRAQACAAVAQWKKDRPGAR